MNIAYSVHKNSNAVFMKYDRAANARRQEAQPLHTHRESGAFPLWWIKNETDIRPREINSKTCSHPCAHWSTATFKHMGLHAILSKTEKVAHITQESILKGKNRFPGDNFYLLSPVSLFNVIRFLFIEFYDGCFSKAFIGVDVSITTHHIPARKAVCFAL